MKEARELIPEISHETSYQSSEGKNTKFHQFIQMRDGGKDAAMLDPDLYSSHNYHEADLNFHGGRWGEGRSRLAFIITSPSKTFIELRLKPLHWFFPIETLERNRSKWI